MPVWFSLIDRLNYLHYFAEHSDASLSSLCSYVSFALLKWPNKATLPSLSCDSQNHNHTHQMITHTTYLELVYILVTFQILVCLFLLRAVLHYTNWFSYSLSVFDHGLWYFFLTIYLYNLG